MLTAILAGATAKLLLSVGLGATVGAGIQQGVKWWHDRKEKQTRESIK